MKNYLNKSTFKGIKSDLAEKYGAFKSDEIWKYANSEYHKLETAEPDADKTSRSYVFPAVSIYRAIEHYAPGEALGVMRLYGTKMGLKLKKLFGSITSLPGMPALMWKNMDKIAAKMSSGYDVKNLRVEKDKCYMDVVACPLYDKAKVLGTPEAVQMICCMDKEYMNGFRGVAYQRTKSVAEGDDCCDYRLNKSV